MKAAFTRIFLIVSLLLLGVALALVVEAYRENMPEKFLIGALLAPLVGYAVLSLGISEIGFGGFKAKFGKAASEKIDHNFGKIPPSR